MKVKIKLDASDIRELGKEYEQTAQKAFSLAAAKGDEFAQKRAAETLKSEKPLNFWKKGYSFHQVNSNTYVFALEGEMANIFDEGQTSKLPEKLLKSPKAKSGKKGKYIDIPFLNNPDKSGNIKIGRSEKVNVSMFKSGDDLRQAFGRNKKDLNRIEQIITSRQRESKPRKQQQPVYKKSEESYLVIKRVNTSTIWNNMLKPPGIFADGGRNLGRYIFKEFDKIFEKIS